MWIVIEWELIILTYGDPLNGGGIQSGIVEERYPLGLMGQKLTLPDAGGLKRKACNMLMEKGDN